MKVSDAVLSRRSIRQFLDKPVPLDVLQRVMDKARWAASGCNFQPWEATIMAGEPLKALQAKMLASPPQDPIEYDWNAPSASPAHLARVMELGATMYGSLGISREDTATRQAFMERNMYSFGAPAVLMCYMPRLMKEPQWSDVGMWMQTVMLLLREEGLDSCPQEYLSLHGRLIKQELGIDDETHIFFCGLAIGYRDEEAPVNNFERARVPLEDNVAFVGF
jgi:nitroreductase